MGTHEEILTIRIDNLTACLVHDTGEPKESIFHLTTHFIDVSVFRLRLQGAVIIEWGPYLVIATNIMAGISSFHLQFVRVEMDV